MRLMSRNGEFGARHWGESLSESWKSMQTPNYQFEKRRKEMNKKAQKEEKRLHKIEVARLAAVGNAVPPVSPVEPA
ncbi:MAG: hypothetical protein WCK89_17745 [bacterium]